MLPSGSLTSVPYVHTCINTLPHLTSPYLTLHCITLHYITLHITYIHDTHTHIYIYTYKLPIPFVAKETPWNIKQHVLAILSNPIDAQKHPDNTNPSPSLQWRHHASLVPTWREVISSTTDCLSMSHRLMIYFHINIVSSRAVHTVYSEQHVGDGLFFWTTDLGIDGIDLWSQVDLTFDPFPGSWFRGFWHFPWASIQVTSSVHLLWLKSGSLRKCLVHLPRK